MGRALWIVSVLAVAAGCKPLSTGPFFTLMALERWHRVDPPNEHTMTGLITFHRDNRWPYWRVLDDYCGVAYGNFADAKVRPPSYGTIRMRIGEGKEVTWPDEPETGWEDAKEALTWDSGDRLHVTAEGREGPAFEVDAIVPPQVELTSHDFRSLRANELHIPRSAPLELRWAPVEGGVHLLIMQFNTQNSLMRQRGIWCVFPAAPGEVSVSTDILGHLLPSSPELSTNIYFGGGSRQKLAFEEIDLEVFTFKNEVARIQID